MTESCAAQLHCWYVLGAANMLCAAAMSLHFPGVPACLQTAAELHDMPWDPDGSMPAS